MAHTPRQPQALQIIVSVFARQTVNDHNFLLHDGRARGFAEAILWHGGEAEAAKPFPAFRQSIG